jgi:hypothetical protein
LDADDIFLPQKFELEIEAVRRTNAQMVFTNTQYWFSWTGSASSMTDFLPALPPPGIYSPPELLRLWLTGQSAAPATCGVLITRDALENTGGFEEGSFGTYEDQVFFAKVCLSNPVAVVDEVTSRYRQHPTSACASVTPRGLRDTRQMFLMWLERYMVRTNTFNRDVQMAVRAELWKLRNPRLARARRLLKTLIGRRPRHRVRGRRVGPGIEAAIVK